MYYKERQDGRTDKNGDRLWRPEIVRTGKVINVRMLSKQISMATTLTQADIAAVLYSLPQFINMHLKEGHTVRLDGMGTYTVYGRTRGKGVLKREDVRPSQFGSLVVKFTPEYTISYDGVRSRSILDDIEFTNINQLKK